MDSVAAAAFECAGWKRRKIGPFLSYCSWRGAVGVSWATSRRELTQTDLVRDIIVTARLHRVNGQQKTAQSICLHECSSFRQNGSPRIPRIGDREEAPTPDNVRCDLVS